MEFTAISVGRGKSPWLVTGRNGEVAEDTGKSATSRTSPCLVARMSRACRGLHEEVGIMEFWLERAAALAERRATPPPSTLPYYQPIHKSSCTFDSGEIWLLPEHFVPFQSFHRRANDKAAGTTLCHYDIVCCSQECPSGVVDEETFKGIYAQFFPQGSKSCSLCSCNINTDIL